MSNGLEPDQDRRSVGPGLGPNCFLRLSADNKSRRLQANSYALRIKQGTMGNNADSDEMPNVCKSSDQNQLEISAVLVKRLKMAHFSKSLDPR